jgi:hypothetical protein
MRGTRGSRMEREEQPVDMLLVHMPRRSRILARSLARGAGWGSASGALVLLGPAVVVACASCEVAVLVPAVLFSLIAVVVGLLVGIACGLSAGIALVVLRCAPGVGRRAVRMTAATGAALLPAAWLITMAAAGTRFWLLAAALTAMTFGLGAAGGPAVFYDERRRRPR